jgi:hypothetical protein
MRGFRNQAVLLLILSIEAVTKVCPENMNSSLQKECQLHNVRKANETG